MAAGDISDALAAELAIRLEDETEAKFSATTKIKMLDQAQLELCNLLHDNYLTELQASYVGSGVTTSVGFSTINSGGILRGGEGIVNVYISPGGSNPTWALKIDLDDIKKTENTYQTYSNTRPMYYMFDEKVEFLLTTQSGNNVIIYFLEKPATITTDVDPTIGAGLYHLLLDLAEAKCWTMNRQFDRKDAVLEHAMRQINILNERYTPAEGVGTKRR